jgi:AcrR family transcriptional regulator
MQFQKEDIKSRVIDAARKEFRENGFERASIRNITAAAKTSKSNVYNYFKDKDALFAAVVEPTLTGINKGLEMLWAGNSTAGAKTYSVAAQGDVISKIMEFVFGHEGDLKLLLFCSSGSSLTGFKDRVTKGLADVLLDWISFAAPDKGITDFFVQTIAGFYIGAIEQMLAQNVTKEQADRHWDVFLKFVYGGWNAVLNQYQDIKK